MSVTQVSGSASANSRARRNACSASCGRPARAATWPSHRKSRWFFEPLATAFWANRSASARAASPAGPGSPPSPTSFNPAANRPRPSETAASGNFRSKALASP